MKLAIRAFTPKAVEAKLKLTYITHSSIPPPLQRQRRHNKKKRMPTFRHTEADGKHRLQTVLPHTRSQMDK